jgi:hypothetical protein
MTDTERNKKLFIKKLGGTPIGHDIFGRDVFEGDFIVYAPSGGFSGTSMKVGKIVRVETNQLRYGITYVLHLETARKRSGSWVLGGKGRFENLAGAAMLWTDPIPEVIALFDTDKNGK